MKKNKLRHKVEIELMEINAFRKRFSVTKMLYFNITMFLKISETIPFFQITTLGPLCSRDMKFNRTVVYLTDFGLIKHLLQKK